MAREKIICDHCQQEMSLVKTFKNKCSYGPLGKTEFRVRRFQCPLDKSIFKTVFADGVRDEFEEPLKAISIAERLLNELS